VPVVVGVIVVAGMSVNAAVHEARDLLAHPLGDRRGRRIGAQGDEGDREPVAPVGCVRCHPIQIGADMRSEVLLVDDEKIRADDPGSALPRDVVAARYVDHEHLHVGERRAEDRGQVVPAALDEDEVELGLTLEAVTARARLLVQRTRRS